MANVIISSSAERDFTESLCWYSERSAEAAKNFDLEFDRAIHQTSSDPERFPFCDSRHRFFVMRLFPFQIIYRLVHDEIVVIAVAHASRSPGFWTDR
jgi:plasmid stabilization system protein ParE